MDFKKYSQYIAEFKDVTASLNAKTFVIGSFTYLDSLIDIYASQIGLGSKKILLTSGIHGEEQAAPFGLLEFVKTYIQSYLKDYSFTIIPIVNPVGFEKRRRRGSANRDLNRYFGKPVTFPENKIIIEFLSGKKFDHFIDMHEDSCQFEAYMYESGDGIDDLKILSSARAFLDSLADLDIGYLRQDKIYGSKLDQGIVYLRKRLTKFPADKAIGALGVYLFLNGISNRITTLETPGKLDFEKRMVAQVRHLVHWLG